MAKRQGTEKGAAPDEVAAPVADVTETEREEAREAEGPSPVTVRLRLARAGSFASSALKIGPVKKGQPVEADAETARRLLETGLFEEA
ncbi:MAG: hypothetical protein IJR14_02145 [Synergistaceae bacterium]|nr:hypothetical protein [Synergistaceae bacterium]